MLSTMTPTAIATPEITKPVFEKFMEIVSSNQTISNVLNKFRVTLLKFIKHNAKDLSRTPNKSIRMRKIALLKEWHKLKQENFFNQQFDAESQRLIEKDFEDLCPQLKVFFVGQDLDTLIEDLEEGISYASQEEPVSTARLDPVGLHSGARLLFSSSYTLAHIKELEKGVEYYTAGEYAKAIEELDRGITKIRAVPHPGSFYQETEVNLLRYLAYAHDALTEEMVGKENYTKSFAHARLSLLTIYAMDEKDFTEADRNLKISCQVNYNVMVEIYQKYLLATNQHDQLITFLRNRLSDNEVQAILKIDLIPIRALLARTIFVGAQQLPILNDNTDKAEEALRNAQIECEKVPAYASHPALLDIHQSCQNSLVNALYLQGSYAYSAHQWLPAFKYCLKAYLELKKLPATYQPIVQNNIEGFIYSLIQCCATSYLGKETDLTVMAACRTEILELVKEQDYLLTTMRQLSFRLLMNLAANHYTNNEKVKAFDAIYYAANQYCGEQPKEPEDYPMKSLFRIMQFLNLTADSSLVMEITVANRLAAQIAYDKGLSYKTCMKELPAKIKMLKLAVHLFTQTSVELRTPYEVKALDATCKILTKLRKTLRTKLNNSIINLKERIKHSHSIFDERRRNKYKEAYTVVSGMVAELTIIMRMTDAEPGAHMQNKIDNFLRDYRTFPHKQAVATILSYINDLMYLKEGKPEIEMNQVIEPEQTLPQPRLAL